MNENMEMQENQEVTQEVVSVPQVAQQPQMVPAPVQEQKSGLTNGQKAAGITVIGFAIGGIVWLVLSIVKGVKKFIGWCKKKAPAQEPASQQAAAPAAEATAQAPVTPEQPAQTQTQAAPEEK